MTDPKQAVHEVRAAVHGHFERSADCLALEQVMEMTALDEGSVSNALAVLYNKGEIAGVKTKDYPFPNPIRKYVLPL